MAKVKPFIAIFLPAYLLLKILLSIFNMTGFSLASPRFLDLILELIFWSASWAVSGILYKTLRNARGSQVEK